MLGWRIFAILVALMGIWSVYDQIAAGKPWGPMEIIGFPIAIWGAFGLTVHAFSLGLFSRKVWNVSQLIFLSWIVFSMRLILGGDDKFGFKLAAAAIIALLMGFNWLALYRLAGSPWSARIKRST